MGGRAVSAGRVDPLLWRQCRLGEQSGPRVRRCAHRPAFGASPDPGTLTASPGHGPFVLVEGHDIVTNGTPATGAYLQIVPREGDPAQVVVPPQPIDLGTTGTLQTTPWAG